MKAVISGMVCAYNPEGAKDKDDKSVPVTDIYSDGEVVKVRGLSVSDKYIGTFVDVPCKIQLKEWEGRKYISVQALPQE